MLGPHLATMSARLQRPRPKPDYRLEKLDQEVLLYHPASTKALYLSETASLIWSLCDGHRTTGQIVELLTEAFPEEAGTIGGEVEATLRRFVEQDALEFV
jgi:hypothetical protein